MNASATRLALPARALRASVLGWVGALALLGLPPAQAADGDVHVYRAGQAPSEELVARVLSGAPTPPRMKMRGGGATLNEPAANEPQIVPDTAPARELAWVDAGRSAVRDWQAQQKPPAVREQRPARPHGEQVALLVPFAHDSDHLPRVAEPALTAMARGIRKSGAKAVLIEGHTSASGSLEHNLALSYRRAASVKRYLVQHCGLDAARLKLAGLGPSHPLDPEHPNAALNRRVQFRAL